MKTFQEFICIPEEVVKEGHGPWGKMTQDKLDKIAKAKKREEKEKGLLRKPGSTLRKDATNYVAKVNDLSEEELEEGITSVYHKIMSKRAGSKADHAFDMGDEKEFAKHVDKAEYHRVKAGGKSTKINTDPDKKSLTYREEVELDETAAWQRKEGKSESGGLNQKGVDSYRRENPGSKLKTAVTTKPSKLKAGSAAANRRKSFCARMSGMKKRLTSAATAKDPDSRINKSLRKWNC